MNGFLVFMLPKGYIDGEGVRHREAALGSLTGQDEEVLVRNCREDNMDGTSLVSLVLGRCLKRVGTITPVPNEVISGFHKVDRDFLLLRLYETTFGNLIRRTLSCPRSQCGEPVDISFSIEDLCQGLLPDESLDLEVSCPECRNAFEIPFDPATLFLNQLRAGLNLLYREVHTLSFHYHWNEHDILAMPRDKRHMYIDILADELERMNGNDGFFNHEGRGAAPISRDTTPISRGTVPISQRDTRHGHSWSDLGPVEPEGSRVSETGDQALGTETGEPGQPNTRSNKSSLIGNDTLRTGNVPPSRRERDDGSSLPVDTGPAVPGVKTQPGEPDKSHAKQTGAGEQDAGFQVPGTVKSTMANPFRAPEFSGADLTKPGSSTGLETVENNKSGNKTNNLTTKKAPPDSSMVNVKPGGNDGGHGEIDVEYGDIDVEYGDIKNNTAGKRTAPGRKQNADKAAETGDNSTRVQRIEQLRSETRRLKNPAPQASAPSAESNRQDHAESWATKQKPPPPPVREKVIVRYESPPEQRSESSSFWERSYLGRFHLKTLR